MNTIKTILVPYDFSPISKRALDYAIDFIGMDTDIKILLAHIAEEEDTEPIEVTFTEVKASKANFRGSMEWIIRKGSLTEALIAIQKNQTVDLVIMGTSGEDGKYMLKVNNTSKLAIEIDDCSVIAIPDQEVEFSISKIALVRGKDKAAKRSVLETWL